MALNLRRATAADIATLAEIGYEAFKIYGRPDQLEHARHIAEHAWSDFLIMEEDGRPVAQAATARHPMQVGSCQILKADVGHVAVLPELQGRGLGSHLMREIIARLPGEGFHCTRLGGLMKYYRRFGYEPFPRRYVQIPLQPLDEDCKGVTWRDLLTAPPAAAARVRPYEPHGDHVARWELQARFDAERSGRYVVHPGAPPPPGGALNPLCLVYEQDGALHGFLQGFVGPVHAGQPPAYQIADLAVDYDCPALEALVKAFLTQAASVAPTTVSCRLPYDERLLDALTAAGIQYDLQEMRGAFDGNMMQVLDLPGLLEAIAPELTARLDRAGFGPWTGTLRLELPRQAAVLTVAPDGVTAAPEGATDAMIELSHAILLKWVLGIAGTGEYPWLTAHLTGPQQVMLGLLFPRTATASGLWG